MESLGFHLPPTHPCLQTQLPVQHYESTKVFLACLMGKGRDSINYRLKTLKKKNKPFFPTLSLHLLAAMQ